jgi:hypothetical protein
LEKIAPKAATPSDPRAETGDAGDGEHHHRRRSPRVGRTAEAREEHDRGEAAGEQRGAEVVDAVPRADSGRLERDGDHAQRDEPDREVDVEDPAPREVIDEEAAEERPDHRRDAEHGAEVALVAAALPRWNDVPDDGDRDDDQAAAAEALQGTEGDQLLHVLAEAAERGADEEDRDRRLQHDLAAVEIAELAVDRPGDGRGEQVRRDDPGELRDAAEVADDRRQRRRHDRLVERREQEHEHQRAEDQAHAMAARGRRGFGSGAHHGDERRLRKLVVPRRLEPGQQLAEEPVERALLGRGEAADTSPTGTQQGGFDDRAAERDDAGRPPAARR